MSLISNRFFVTALDDGTTLHGNLAVEGSLSQAWNSATQTAVPDWGNDGTGKAEQPTIVLTLLSGATYIGTSASSANGYISQEKWYYNGNEIFFSSTSSSITVDGQTITGYKSTSPLADVFFKLEQGTQTERNGVRVPCLRVIKNLASSSNVDLDTIMFAGKYNKDGAELDFQASAQVRISQMSSGGYLGVISFANGISNITDQDQTISMSGTLYGSTNNTVSSFKTAWYLNGELFRAKSTSNTGITVTGANIVDNAIVRCDFYVTIDGNDVLVASDYASIDDLQDPQMMYIQYHGQNGNAASLRKGQSAVFDIWIGKNNDDTVLTEFAYFQVKLLNGSGAVITANLPNIPDAGEGGWRNLTLSNNKAQITISYDVVNTNNKNITGLLRASTSAFS